MAGQQGGLFIYLFIFNESQPTWVEIGQINQRH